MASRVASSMLSKHSEYQVLLARNAEDYQFVANYLMSERGRSVLNQLRDRVIAGHISEVLDTHAWTRHFEVSLRLVWEMVSSGEESPRAMSIRVTPNR